MLNKNERMAKLNEMGVNTGKYFTVNLDNGTKVTLIHDKKKGKIEIEYYGNEDLDRILSLIEQV